MVTAVDASYRQAASCAFVMNAGTQKALAGLVDTTGRRMFHKILDAQPSIFEYPVLICPNVDSVASGNNPVLFGALEYIFTRSEIGYQIQTLREQFATSFQTGVIAVKRGDMTYSLPSASDSAVKYIAVS